MTLHDEKRKRLAEELRKRVGQLRYAPVSFAQERLWFLDQFSKNTNYNVPLNVRIGGLLERDSLEYCFDQIARRHEVFRTTFEECEGLARQVIHPASSIHLEYQDLSAMELPAQRSKIETWYREQSEWQFDLSRPPLWKIQLLRLAEQEHLLFVTTHHILSDGWSLEILISEVNQLYTARRQGQPSPLKPLEIQYADYARWQRECLQGEKLESELGYWRERLKGAPALLELPTDRPRPSLPVPTGATHSFRFADSLSSRLKLLSREQHTTMFMLLLACFQILLARHAGEDDICVGTPVAGRNSPQTEPLIGLFVNMLVLRSDLRGEPSFLTFLQQVKEVSLAAFAHQEVPFELVVEALKPERDLRHTPLFQVMFGLQNTAEQIHRGVAGDFEVQAMPAENTAAKFDLSLILHEVDRHIAGSIEYRTDLFGAATIERMAKRLETLAEEITTDPERSIIELPLLPDAERRQILMLGRGPESTLADAFGLGKLFEEQVARTPEATALIYEGRRWTYRELNEHANQISHYLARYDAGPERVIGIAMERSPEMIMALYGIVKTGSAYLPLDLEYPLERLRYMIRCSSACLILSRKSEADALGAGDELESVPLIRLDMEEEIIARQSTANTGRTTEGHNLAYVIFTSGSTGVPKGVMNTNQGINNRLRWMQARYGLSAEDRVLQKTPYSFDVSVWELFWPLLVGAQLVIARPAGHRDSRYLAEVIEEYAVTTIHFVPSMLEVFLQQADLTLKCRSLRRVISSGEALTGELAKRAQRCFGVPLENLYGPTEAAVDVTWWSCREEDECFAGSEPIGYPIQNLKMYVLDREMRVSPIGVEGELYIGGLGLGRGYVSRAELTAERFVPNPYSEQPGERIYRTGDRGRWSAGGWLEYLGRADDQVKIRGFRIELAEIEAALQRHPAIREAVAVVREGNSGDKRLLAYIVGRDEPRVTGTDLRAFLLQYLPEYMTPSSYIVLPQLPLTPHGKVDRRSLSKGHPGARLGVGSVFASPRTPVESALSAIWQQVLDLETVGIDDNFFALGGDSILALRVLSFARGQGLRLTLQQLFQSQTVRQLAQHSTGDQAPASKQIAPFELVSEVDREKLPQGLADAYPLTRLQFGMLYHNELNPDLYHNVHWRMVRGRFDEGRLRETLAAVVAHHPILRTSFDVSSYSEPLQLVHADAVISFTVDTVQATTEEERSQAIQSLLQQEMKRQFDVRKAPLLRASVYQITDERFLLIFAEPHAIFDGWSVALFLIEWVERYWSAVKGLEYSAWNGENPFRDYVALERQALLSKEHEAFWLKQMEGFELTKIVVDSEWNAAEKASSVSRPAITPEVSQDLKKAAQVAGVPLKSLLLAAHLRVLGFISGRKDVITGLVTHGRPEAVDSDRALGLFLNSLPFRCRLEEGSWIELAREVFQQEREMFEHRYYPMSAMQRVANVTELFESVFNFTYFHVYRDVEGIGDWELEDSRSVAPNNIPLSVNFTLEPGSGELRLDLIPGNGHLSVTQMEEIAGYYERVLIDIARNAQGKYGRDVFLTRAQQRQLLVDRNQTHKKFPRRCVHQAFEDQVSRTPDAIAVEYEGTRISYADLNRRANQLARYLKRLGTKPDSVVGICMERSPEMIIGLLGILKAGGAYMPLDPGYPAQRLLYMQHSSRCERLLVQERFRSKWPAETALVSVDAQWSEIAQLSATNLKVEIDPDNLAYVLYTSGSTGRPKGVMISHASLSNHMSWMQETFGIREQDRVLQKTVFHFDASVWEFYAPLLAGGCLVLARPGGQRDREYLVQCLIQDEITIAQFVPSQLQLLAEINGLESCRMLRYIFCGGEALKTDLVKLVISRAPWIRFFNLYGPTEATIDACYEECSGADQYSTAALIGTPIANTQAYVVDENMGLVPTGVWGELCLGGEGLARGYMGSSELTAGRFVPNPFSPVAGARLYLTGDVVRWRANGKLEFSGRRDYQIKLRGHRLELAEIEGAMESHPAVKQAAVMLREGKAAERRLVGYAVLREPLNPEELQQWLKRSLPEYMVPASFAFLKEMPLSTNGKIDRGALPIAALELRGKSYAAPRTPAEQKVAAIWATVLGVERVGLEDNFFDLGGHSLLATLMISRIRQTCDVDLPLRAAFEAPTVAELANRIEREERKNTTSTTSSLEQAHSPTSSPVPNDTEDASLVALRRAGDQTPFFCVHPVGGTVFCYVDLARYLDTSQPFYAFQSLGLTQGQEPQTSVPAMAATYCRILRKVQTNGPYLLGGWSLGGVIAFEMARQLEATGQPVALLALFDSHLSTYQRDGNRAENGDDRRLLVRFAADLGVELDAQLLRPGSSDEDGQDTFRMIVKQAQQQGSLPDLDPHLASRLFRVFKANTNAFQEYVPGEYQGRMTYFEACGRTGTKSGRATLLHRLARGGVDHHAVPGDHYTMFDRENSGVLARALSTCISSVTSERTEQVRNQLAPLVR